MVLARSGGSVTAATAVLTPPAPAALPAADHVSVAIDGIAGARVGRSEARSQPASGAVRRCRGYRTRVGFALRFIGVLPGGCG